MWRYGLYLAAKDRDSCWVLVNMMVWAVSCGYGKDSWWALVNVSVWALLYGYGEGQFVGIGECGGMGCIERLKGG
jgi:cyanate permease